MRRWSILMGLILAVSCVASASAGDEVDPPRVPAHPGGAPLQALQREVVHFDFEEAALAPISMPLHFYRLTDPIDVFPPFGRVELRSDHAHSGGWSLGFEVESGSMGVAVPTAVIPVVPNADYRVSVMVRTEGLARSGVQLAARLHDAHGEPIPNSQVASEVARSAERWTELAVIVRGDDPDAADLVLELLLLQPRHVAPQHDDALDPVLEDTSGRAWFDDVRVRHEPRIHLATDPPGNLVDPGRPGQLTVLVRDLASEPITARLRVLDLSGRVVHEERFDAPRGPQPRTVVLPRVPAGPYRAVLDVDNDRRTVSRRSLDFVVLAPAERRVQVAHNRFTVFTGRLPTAHLDAVPALVSRLLAGRVALPAWVEDDEEAAMRGYHPALREVLEALLSNGHEVMLTLDAVPHDLQQRFSYEADDVAEALAADPAQWRAHLDELLVTYGLEVGRWQIGAATPAGFHRDPPTAAMLAKIGRAFSRFVPAPLLGVPTTAEAALSGAADPAVPDPSAPPAGATADALSGGAGGAGGSGSGAASAAAASWRATETVLVPHAISPPRLGTIAGELAAIDDDRVLVLDTLPLDRFTPRQQVTDLAQRALYAWRGGSTALAILPPWRLPDTPGARPDPDARFAAWRVLSDRLNSRRVFGDLDIGRHAQCWMLSGVREDDAAIVAWSDHPHDMPGDEPPAVDMVLAGGPVRVIDLFGNERIVHPGPDGRHTIMLDDMPVFIEDISLELAAFRAAFDIVPHFVPAQSRLHEHELVIGNPWPFPITGRVQLSSDDQRQIRPASQEFSIRPGAEERLPITLVMDRRLTAGTKRIDAMIDLVADREYRLSVSDDLEVGLPNLEVTTNWFVSPNERTGQRDLVIMQYVANTGETTVNLESFLLAPDVPRQGRPIVGLEPSTSAWRAFRVANGVELLSGRELRVGVAMRDGVGRLNYSLRIPDLRVPDEHEDTAPPHR